MTWCKRDRIITASDALLLYLLQTRSPRTEVEMLGFPVGGDVDRIGVGRESNAVWVRQDLSKLQRFGLVRLYKAEPGLTDTIFWKEERERLLQECEPSKMAVQPEGLIARFLSKWISQFQRGNQGRQAKEVWVDITDEGRAYLARR